MRGFFVAARRGDYIGDMSHFVTPNFEIRRARADDLAAVDAMMSVSYPVQLKLDYPPSVLVLALPLIARAQPQLLRSGNYFVALSDGGDILGAGGFSHPDPGSGRRQTGVGHVRHLVTEHRHTRRGIGRALMAHIESAATGQGITTLGCLSTRTAVPFYLACGYVQDGPVTIALRPGIEFPAIRMQKAL